MSDAVQVALLGLTAIALIGAGLWHFLGRRVPPAERERKRRLAVHRLGRMGDAMITDFRDHVIYYTYEVRGVSYIASQDVTSLEEKVPAEPTAMIGHAGLKYHPRNPANSIVLCEEWSGLRTPIQSVTGDING